MKASEPEICPSTPFSYLHFHEPPLTLARLLQEIMRKGGSDDSRRDDGTKTWTHDLYEEIAEAERYATRF